MLRNAMGLVGPMVALVLAGCEQGPLPPEGSASDVADGPRQTLASAFRQCTIDYEYDPDAAGSLDVAALGDGEAEWRECAYQALGRVLQPSLSEPEALAGLIDEDRRQTQAIAAGTATRADRSAAIGARLDVMALHEEALRQEELSEMSAGDLLGALHGGSDEALQALRSDLSEVREALQ